MIKFNGVNKWFGKLHVLRDIDLHIPSGEVVVAGTDLEDLYGLPLFFKADRCWG